MEDTLRSAAEALLDAITVRDGRTNIEQMEEALKPILARTWETGHQAGFEDAHNPDGITEANPFGEAFTIVPDEPPACPDHKEVQHRDRKPPWCDTCGWSHGRPAVPPRRYRKRES